MDLKHKSKTKLSKRKREALGTGGGPSSQGELSELEKKILAIIGEQAVFGDSVHKVPVFVSAIISKFLSYILFVKSISQLPNSHSNLYFSEH